MLKKLSFLFIILFAFGFANIKQCYAAAIEEQESKDCVVCTEAVGTTIAKNNYFMCGHESGICQSCLGKIGICPLCRKPSYARLFFKVVTAFEESRSFSLAESCGDSKFLRDHYCNTRYNDKENPNFAFIRAAMIGNTHNVLDLYAKTQVNIADISFAIMASSVNNHIETLKQLFKLGKDIERDDLSFSLILACVRGNIAIAKLLIDHGADINYMGKIGINPLTSACFPKQNSLELINLLLKHGANVNQELNIGSQMAMAINCITYSIEMPLDEINLQEASLHDDINFTGILPQVAFTCYLINNTDLINNFLLIKLLQLLRQIFEIEYKSTNEYTAIDSAVLYNNNPVVETLLQNKARISPITLNLAIEKENIQLFDLFLSKDINVNMMDPAGCYPLQVAVMKNSDYMIKKILAKGANINCKGRFGTSPLLLAASLGYDEIIKLLIENGADVNITDEHGLNILSFAVTSGSLKTVQESLKYINADHVYPEGNGILHFAVALDSTEVVTELIHRGANINIVNDDGNTPLILAAYNMSRNNVICLLENRAGVLHKNKEGKSALDYAIENEYQDEQMINILQAAQDTTETR